MHSMEMELRALREQLMQNPPPQQQQQHLSKVDRPDTPQDKSTDSSEPKNGKRVYSDMADVTKNSIVDVVAEKKAKEAAKLESADIVEK